LACLILGLHLPAQRKAQQRPGGNRTFNVAQLSCIEEADNRPFRSYGALYNRK